MIEREVNFHDIVKPITGVRELQLAYEKFSSYINPEQTPSSLLEHVKEEVAELDEAIQNGDKKTLLPKLQMLCSSLLKSLTNIISILKKFLVEN